MTTIQEELLAAIESTPESIFEQALNYLKYLKSKKNGSSVKLVAVTPEAGEPILRGAKAKYLLKVAGTWKGDDFEECLQVVYDTRTPTEF